MYGVNLIAKNMLRTANNEGYHKSSLNSIVDVRFNSNAVKESFICDKHDKRQMRKTTAGVDLLVAIRD